MVDYLADQTGRMTLDNVNASFDSSTGNLSGSITVNLFSMAGTGQTYTEPDAGSVAYGTDNIFGTIESGKKSTKKESILTTNSRCSPLMIFNYVQRTIPPISLLTLS